ncbi:tripartite tricarboxylate transporter substrate binding protein [Roseicella sp. DB1501]|uniref:Bug family tripartite tricarboxylate transporter substrate binding protein n=1 Tax=Roseicella sp. DB1501 TaxID=2730925 RepID=UPI0014921F8B|nr:tripartite tricarboxylate transporter substrate binding protein [Roseicella sp. DB1501]NOG71811.1 tripartite tricarboxylate transporter substrate binding protein [Roseicella sp. DB1501]
MRALIGIAMALLLWPAIARAEFPDRPIRMLYGFAPGGSGDIAARLLADTVSPLLGQPVVVENRTGANGLVAAEAAAKSPPDGHTVLFCTTGNMTIVTELPGLRLPVNPAKELMGLAMMARTTFGLVVAPNSPWHGINDILAAARQAPGQIGYASPGIGSVQHLASELLKQKTGTDMIHVPYRGSQPALLDIVSGRIGFTITNLGDTIGQIRQGSLRLIGLGDPLAQTFFPDVPLIARDVPGFETYAWFGLCAPRGLPESVIGRWEAAVRQAVDEPKVREKLMENGLVPRFAGSAALNALMEENRATFRGVIQAADIRAQ